MSLSEQSVGVVKATAPVVAEHATAITSTFYRTMFANNPEVLAFFNKTNQEKGRQQQALAAAVVEYATHIEDLGALGPLVEKIAHRHVGLSVTADMYPTVHRNLMLAIGEVLGDAVTPEIAEAWSEAVLTLAKVCIDAEEQLYQKLAAREGGWRGEQEFRVVAKETVAEDTVSFSFAKDGYSGGFEFTPGQYLTIRLPGLQAAPRHYTVTSRPGDRVLQCTVRRVPGGVMSNHLHDQLQLGDAVLLAPPCGVFTPSGSERPKVLVSGGIGVTPLLAFLRHGNVKAALHVDKTESRHAFKAEFEGAGCRCFYTKDLGRPDLAKELAKIVEEVGGDADFYVCGPLDFSAEVVAALTSAGATAIYSEVFGTGEVPGMKAGRCPVAGASGGRCPFAG